MHSALRAFRYFVFGLFLASNAIIITAAVWNLNLVQDALLPASSLPLRTDAYLVFVGCAGLALIAPVLFCELAAKSVFLVSVWFECTWVALFCVMELAGAVASTAAGMDACPPGFWVAIAVDRRAICTSSRLLQAFSWICGMLLLVYFVLLFVTCLLMRRDDDTIWRCNAARLPWSGAQHKLDGPTASPMYPGQHSQEPKGGKHKKKPSILSRVRSAKAPTIAHPRPRRAMTESIRRAILSYRSGLSVDYTIEHFRPEDPVVEEPQREPERPLPPAPVAHAPEPPSVVTREAAAATFGSSLYPQHVLSVIPKDRQAQAVVAPPLPPPPPPAAVAAQPQPTRETEEVPRKPVTPSPIGDWPRMNPSTPMAKRKSQRVPPVVIQSRQRQQSFPPLASRRGELPQPPTQTRGHQRQKSSPASPRPAFLSLPARSSAPSQPRIPTFDFEGGARGPLVSASAFQTPPTSAAPPPSTQRQSLSRPLPPPTSFSSSRTRPSGPRRPSLEESRNPQIPLQPPPQHAPSSYNNVVPTHEFRRL